MLSRGPILATSCKKPDRRVLSLLSSNSTGPNTLPGFSYSKPEEWRGNTQSASEKHQNKTQQFSLSQEELSTGELMRLIMNQHSCRKISFCDAATELYLWKKIPIYTCWTNHLISDQRKVVWMLCKQELFHMAWVSHPTGKAGVLPTALLPMRLEVSEEPPQTQAGRVPKTKASHRIQQLACNGTIWSTTLSCCNAGDCLQCSRVLHSCQPRSCFIIIFTVLLLFWEFKSV